MMTPRQARLIRKGVLQARHMVRWSHFNVRVEMPAPGGLAGYAFRTYLYERRYRLDRAGYALVMSPDNRYVRIELA